MIDEDTIHEVRKALRALRRVETRYNSDRRQEKRREAKQKEAAELRALAEEARAKK